MLSKDYGFTSEELDAVLEKPLGEMTEEESKIFFTYSTELAAHETEIALGNEQFIDKIVMEDESTARKLVSRLLTLDKAFSSLKDKNARAQAKLIREAEKLYLKAAENSGNAYIKKMILAHRPELEEELTRINAEKMRVGDKKVQMDLKDYEEYDKPITVDDVKKIHDIASKTPKQSINSFSSENIKNAQKWAHKFQTELGPKSPFFRASFGEWRAYETKAINIVEEGHNKNYSAGKAFNSDVETTISWGHPFKSETINHLVGEKVSKDAVYDIQSIIENAIYFETNVSGPNSKSKMPYTAFMHSFYTLYRTSDGGLHLLKIYVEEALSNNQKEIFKRGYQLKDIKKVADIPNSVLSKNGGLTEDTPTTTYSISDLYEFVKTFDKDFTPAPDVHKEMLNDDGTPKVFYHGTDGDFTAFSYGEIGNATGVGILGDGFYFTDKKTLAKNYGKNIMPCYLRMSNPYIASVDEAYRLNTDKLASQKYDGVILKAPNGNIYVVFDNTQIKSATDNIGTFSKYEKDIRFNLKKKKDDLGDFFADEKDSGPVYKVSGGKVRKVIADNTRMKVYTRAESEAIINQIVSEQLSFGELYGSLAGKSRNEAIDILWEGLNSADVGERAKVALDVAEYIIQHASVESIYDGEGLEVYTETVDTLKPYLRKLDLSSIKGDIKHVFGKDSSPYLLWQKRRGEVGMTPDQVAEELKIQ